MNQELYRLLSVRIFTNLETMDRYKHEKSKLELI
jgi:hypothetical protein